MPSGIQLELGGLLLLAMIESPLSDGSTKGVHRLSQVKSWAPMFPGNDLRNGRSFRIVASHLGVGVEFLLVLAGRCGCVEIARRWRRGSQ